MTRSCGSTLVPEPPRAHILRRKATRARYIHNAQVFDRVYSILQGSPEVFTFKSNVYQTKLKKLVLDDLLPRMRNGPHRYIDVLDHIPAIPTNQNEDAQIQRLRAFHISPNIQGQLDPKLISELDHLLTALVNKVLFLLLIQMGTCYVRAAARAQILDFVLKTIWPGNNVACALIRPHAMQVVETRIRHFRDSVARYFRPKPTQRSRNPQPCPATKSFENSSVFQYEDAHVITDNAIESSTHNSQVPVESLYAQPSQYWSMGSEPQLDLAWVENSVPPAWAEDDSNNQLSFCFDTSDGTTDYTASSTPISEPFMCGRFR